MLLATRCPVCDVAGPAPCAGCVAAMRRAPLLPPPPGVDRCLALLAYAGAGRELVARLKYRNARAGVRWLAGAMAALVDEPVDLVTWVPTTPARRRQRGFDQAELVARRIAAHLRVPCRSVLRRGPGPTQTGAGAAARRAATPSLGARRAVAGTVVLVDDVVTTGATLSAAARCVRDAGARRVVALVAARTPPPGDLH
ncbi:MAG: ComF family protein [Actinobacteria bacterium]|nr:ComF family protein [Actinomycetota bacterium]